MPDYDRVLQEIKEQFIQKFHPSKLILFGSIAKGTFRETSDIDLCVVQDTDNKRKLLTDMYVEIESEIPFDIVLYTNQEWNECIKDTSAFAYQINNTGVTIYG
nr:nucleotidyltransferase domain-containing protein [uncultured Niameybacter sp.]